MPIRFAWTEEAKALAKRLISEGVPIHSICSTLGCGPNTLWRMKRIERWTVSPEALAERAKRGGPWKRTPKGTDAAVVRDQTYRAQIEVFSYAFVPAAPGEGVSLTELRSPAAHRAQCRWPLASLDEVATRFCGGDVARGVYCAHHHQLAYRPERKFDRMAIAALRKEAKVEDA